ncbi:ABC transporter, permease protein [Treponema phagedenis F0421]|uniref:ABC transporter permease n=1 Tax=Treponema phagedenis TaxID=162 RepID=UPI0001F64150|nr:ABC transporter permease subunit [Treponema phagedenis]EFW38399.1 ABC transporter, permease protein [Treponema phagedenis F0421]
MKDEKIGIQAKQAVHSQRLLNQIWKHRLLYVMFVPAIVYFILLSYVPMAGIVLAFKKYSVTKGIFRSPWIGFAYFRTFFTSYDAGRLLKNTLTVGFMKTILEFPFAIILALLLNELKNPLFKKTTQTITYLPHFLSSVIVITMVQRILAPHNGVINQIIAAFGGDGSTFFLMEAKYFLPILFILDIWKNIGWDSIIYLAAISGVDPNLYEAAEMEGCGRLRQMWHITLPCIRSTIGVLFILGIGSLFSSGFDQIYLLRTPGNMAIADTLDTFVVRVGLANGEFGYATAIGFLQGIIGLILVLVSNKISKRLTDVGIF